MQQPLLLDATVAFPPRDTAHFSVAATTHRCTDGRTILVEAMSPEGNGVLLRLHYRDSLVTGSYPVVTPGDSTTAGAVVVVRYLLRDTPHAFFFDSGAVQVRRARGGDKISGSADGSGTENGIRTPTRILYHDVALPAHTDTVPCTFAW
ncbi:MAG: hypothetical protein DMD40_10035 [Gemmatimonadetes bacterium]|nr:MAG: hypothetical protein DMD40_10035 [Gemmatimonadota bacterium]